MIHWKKETELAEHFRGWLTETYPGCRIEPEVPLYEGKYRSPKIDLVVFTTDGQTLAFETKLTDLRGGVKQCTVRQPHAHRVYLVTPERTIFNSTMDLFTVNGVGLILVSRNKTYIHLNARLNPTPTARLDYALNRDKTYDMAGQSGQVSPHALRCSHIVREWLLENVPQRNGQPPEECLKLVCEDIHHQLGYATEKAARAALVKFNSKESLQGIELIGSGATRIVRVVE